MIFKLNKYFLALLWVINFKQVALAYKPELIIRTLGQNSFQTHPSSEFDPQTTLLGENGEIFIRLSVTGFYQSQDLIETESLWIKENSYTNIKPIYISQKNSTLSNLKVIDKKITFFEVVNFKTNYKYESFLPDLNISKYKWPSDIKVYDYTHRNQAQFYFIKNSTAELQIIFKYNNVIQGVYTFPPDLIPQNSQILELTDGLIAIKVNNLNTNSQQLLLLNSETNIIKQPIQFTINAKLLPLPTNYLQIVSGLQTNNHGDLVFIAELKNRKKVLALAQISHDQLKINNLVYSDSNKVFSFDFFNPQINASKNIIFRGLDSNKKPTLYFYDFRQKKLSKLYQQHDKILTDLGLAQLNPINDSVFIGQPRINNKNEILFSAFLADAQTKTYWGKGLIKLYPLAHNGEPKK